MERFSLGSEAERDTTLAREGATGPGKQHPMAVLFFPIKGLQAFDWGTRKFTLWVFCRVLAIENHGERSFTGAFQFRGKADEAPPYAIQRACDLPLRGAPDKDETFEPEEELPCAGRRGRLKVLKISPGRQSHKH
jgi:hypothetical protein